MFGKLINSVWDSGKPEPKSSSGPPPSSPTPQPSLVAGVVAPPVVAPVAYTTPVLQAPGVVDQEILAILEEAIRNSNLPGFDFLEFRDSLGRMQGVPMSEEQKYQAVFATAQSMGVTKQGLLDAIDHYLKVIAGKDDEFSQFIASVHASQVVEVENTLAQINQDIETQANEIKRLTESIQDRRKQLDALNLQLLQSKQEIENKRAAYTTTRDAVVNSLTSDRNKISAFLR